MNTTLTHDQKAWVTVAIVMTALVVLLVYAATQLANTVLSSKTALEDAKFLVERVQSSGNIAEATPDPTLFSGRNRAEIQSALQSEIKRIGDKYAIGIDSLQPLDVEKKGVLIASKLRLTGSLPEVELAPFLVELSRNNPAVLVTDIDLRPVRVRSARLKKNPDQKKRLAIQLIFEGYAMTTPQLSAR